MSNEWHDLAGWWTDELASDAAYEGEVLPLLVGLLDPQPGCTYLDAGCGDGRIMRVLGETGVRTIGCDVNAELLLTARSAGPVVSCRLPDLGWIRPESLDGAYVSLVVEHLVDLESFLVGLARAVSRRGPLALVVNHPLFTAPESGPVVDPSDGEVFWRWGTYLQGGSTEEPAGEAEVTFYHRPLAVLLNAAADAGWALERTVERAAPIANDPLLAAQQHIPRLLGLRWTRL